MMSRVKQIAMAAGTFSVALGIGFVMQNGDALANRFGLEAPDGAPVDRAAGIAQVAAQGPLPAEAHSGPSLAASAPTVPELDAALALPNTTRAPETATAPVHLAALETDTVPQKPGAATTEARPSGDACKVSVAGTPEKAATVAVQVTAPCHAETPFVLHHQGLQVSAITDSQGRAAVDMPALAPTAVIVAAFPDGAGGAGTVAVPDFDRFDRAVLQWRGAPDLMLSAYEFGADFGDAGHIHRRNTGNAERALSGEGGFMMRLGNPEAGDAPHMAEVYTFPSGQHDRGDIALVAEVRITDANCDASLAAQSIQVRPDGATEALDLSLQMPDCAAVGDYLYLQNMFEDLKLAAR
ncbi:hypothetical protein [Salibaculum halophilum]|uniref:hypothetical protein n=1 Tax=Salibaculum halophilum TaxID=1914408 RepID=UPI000A11B008|nr:hypothetical protein [Salibaculum halophilum]